MLIFVFFDAWFGDGLGLWLSSERLLLSGDGLGFWVWGYGFGVRGKKVNSRDCALASDLVKEPCPTHSRHGDLLFLWLATDFQGVYVLNYYMKIVKKMWHE